jgi:hypothetical protein
MSGPPTSVNLPRQNRVTPFGELIATPARGTLMGNRGCLHDASGRIVRHHVGKRWIHCVLEFKGRRRPIMTPGRYTELFFLDEATALAAGHRPCMECQREQYLEFRRCWMAGQGRAAARQAPSVDVLDAVLHTERLDADGQRRDHVQPWARFPDGIMVAVQDRAHVVHGGHLLGWTPAGYGSPCPDPPAAARALTPPSIIAAIRQGYAVRLHPSAA